MKDIEQNLTPAKITGTITVAEMRKLAPRTGTADLIHINRSRTCVGILEICRRELFRRLEPGDKVQLEPGFGVSQQYTVKDWTTSGKLIHLTEAIGCYSARDFVDFFPAQK